MAVPERRIHQRIGGLDLVIRETGIGRSRNEQGRFIPRDTKALRAEMTLLAEKAQANVVSTIANRLASGPRPMAVTGRLERVTANRRNRVVDPEGLGFGVGVEYFLDRSESKYWRTIEEGSKKTWRRGGMAGMEIRGKFGAAFDWVIDAKRGDRRARAMAPWSINGRSIEGGYFAAFRKMPAMVIRKEIEPMYAYRDVFENGGIFDREAPKVVLDFVRRVARASLVGE